jgi:hypothetical protein
MTAYGGRPTVYGVVAFGHGKWPAACLAVGFVLFSVVYAKGTPDPLNKTHSFNRQCPKQHNP